MYVSGEHRSSGLLIKQAFINNLGSDAAHVGSARTGFALRLDHPKPEHVLNWINPKPSARSAAPIVGAGAVWLIRFFGVSDYSKVHAEALSCLTLACQTAAQVESIAKAIGAHDPNAFWRQ